MVVQMKLLQLLICMLPLVLLSLPSMLGHSSELMDSPSKRIRCLQEERKALLELKNKLVDKNGQLSSWGDDKDRYECCEWRGVYCHNKTNHVTRLDLHNDQWSLDTYMPLEGTISDSILELKHLAYLDLSCNDFSGAPIPRSIASLSSLRYLNLSRASFHGPIPHHLGNLSKLRWLDLSYEEYSYVESLSWVSNLHALEYLDLSDTNLSMATDWLQAVSKLTNLHALHLDYCSLQEIPSSLISSINSSSVLAIVGIPGNSDLTYPRIISWLSNFSSCLTFVDLGAINMSGPIPDVFEKMIVLEHLSLAETGLVGGLPKYFGNMSHLKYLDLSANELNGELFDLVITNLSGPIEKTLQYLDLSQNSIRGLLPNLSRFSFLTELELNKNQLNGSIQAGYLHLPYLLSLGLSSNRIAGPIPDLLLSPSLKEVYLDNNMFNGTLTEKIIGGLHMLEVLRLGSNFLEGKITEAHLSNLSRLRVLDLSHNSLMTLKFQPQWIPPFQLEVMRLRLCSLGPYFPQWLKTQKRVWYIDISSAGISDIIPNWFCSIASRVSYLNISNNQIHGAFPQFSFSHSPPFPVVAFDLSNNTMSGTITFLCHVRDWALLDLSANMFSGSIPDCFTQFESPVHLNLANNYLSGEIPGSIGALGSLSVLHLQNNNLSGVVPISMSNCTNLVMIDLGENRLTGRIPDWLGDSLTKLMVLILRSNNFFGSIPSSLCGLAFVQVLDLSSNKITGDIPGCVGNYTAMTKNGNANNYSNYWIEYGFDSVESHAYLIDNNDTYFAYFMWKGKEVKYLNHLGLVKLIDISNNKLEGEIPSGLTVLDGLVGLNLSGNHLTGYIPWNIGQLMPLNFLDLSRNHLRGGIPSSLSNLDNLGILNLSYNNLSGRIPISNHALTFGESAYIGNNDLCGQPLNKSCQGDHAVTYQDPSVVASPLDNQGQDDDDDDKLISEGFYVAIVLGFVVGFWGIFGTILLNKALRFAFFDKLNSFGDFVYVRMELAKAHVLGH